MSPSDLTPAQLADLDQDHAGAQEALDDLIEAHRVEVARHGEVLATAYLELHLAEQSHDVAAGFAAHAVTRLVRVEAERGDALAMLADLNPAIELTDKAIIATEGDQ
jgi:cytidylate kinase